MSEKYLGIILWADRDGSRGVLADTAGQTWFFTETLPEKIGFGRIPVYENEWRPKVSIQTNRRTGKEFVTTEAEIVQFEIEFFHFSDGRDGSKITRLCAAPDYGQQDYEALSLAREKYDVGKWQARMARHERRKSENDRQENRAD